MGFHELRKAARGVIVGCAAAAVLTACADDDVRIVGETRVGDGSLEVRSTVTPEGQRGNFALKTASQGRQISVNRFLWRAALDSTAFMPLLSADAKGGVIITDWYSPPETPNERFKLTVIVQGGELRSDGVKVTVFKRKKGENGTWVDTKVAKNTSFDFENVILARARDLRDQARNK